MSSFRPFKVSPSFKLTLTPKAATETPPGAHGNSHQPCFVLHKCSEEKGFGHFVPLWQLNFSDKWIPLDIQTVIVDEKREHIGRGNLLDLSRDDAFGLDILYLDKVYRSLGGKGILGMVPKALLYAKHQKRWVLVVEVEVMCQSYFGSPCDWLEVSELKLKALSEYQDPFLQIALHIL